MRVRRLPVIDEYVEQGEAVVFVDGLVVALSPLATVALTAVGTQWTDSSKVAVALLAVFGEPPDARSPLEVTQETLQSLEELGLVASDGTNPGDGDADLTPRRA